MSDFNFGHPADEITLSVSEGLIQIDAQLHRAGSLVRRTVVRAKEVKIEHGKLGFLATTPEAEADLFNDPILSNTTIGERRLTWRERAEQLEQTLDEYRVDYEDGPR